MVKDIEEMIQRFNKTLNTEYPGRSRKVPTVIDIEDRIQRFNKTLDTEYPERSR
jgi:hypothetical protein